MSNSLQVSNVQIDHSLNVFQTGIATIGDQNVFVQIESGLTHGEKDVGQATDVVNGSVEHVRENDVARALVANDGVINLLEIRISFGVPKLRFAQRVGVGGDRSIVKRVFNRLAPQFRILFVDFLPNRILTIVSQTEIASDLFTSDRGQNFRDFLSAQSFGSGQPNFLTLKIVRHHCSATGEFVNGQVEQIFAQLLPKNFVEMRADAAVFGHLHGSPSQTNIQRGLRIAGILIFRCRPGVAGKTCRYSASRTGFLFAPQNQSSPEYSGKSAENLGEILIRSSSSKRPTWRCRCRFDFFSTGSHFILYALT